MRTPIIRRFTGALPAVFFLACTLSTAACERTIVFGTISRDEPTNPGRGSGGRGTAGTGGGFGYATGGTSATGGANGFVTGGVGGVRDIGDSDGGVAITPSAGNPAAANGVWVGHATEPFTFPSGSNLMTFSVNVAGNGATTVQVVFGGTTPPPPPTDPDTGWPAHLTYDNSSSIILPALEGALYETRDVRWESGHLKFNVSRWSPWRAWCQLQRVYPSEITGSGYGCLPPGMLKRDPSGNCYMAATPEATVGPSIDCPRGFPLCISTPAVCGCDVNGCTANELIASFNLILGDDLGGGITDLLAVPNGPAIAHLQLMRTSH